MVPSSKSLNNVIEVDFANHKKIPLLDLSNEDKRQIFSLWLESGVVMLTFDVKHDLIKLPKEFEKSKFLSLNFCHKFGIADFSFNENAVWATLLFDSGEHFCRIPWVAVLAIRSNTLKKLAIWLSDFPKHLDFKEIFGFSLNEHDKKNNVLYIDW